MKRLHITLIVILGILMASLCGILGFYLATGTRYARHFDVEVADIDVKSIDVSSALTGDIDTAEHFFSWDVGRDYTLVLEETVPAEDISSLRVWYEAASNDVLFYRGTGDYIIIREYMNPEADKRQVSAVEEKNGKLTVRGRRKTVFSFFSFHTWSAYTEIYLPPAALEKLEELQVKTVNGYILSDIPFYDMHEFTVSTTSGDVFVPDVRADKILASSTSGYVRLAGASGEQISVSTVSGDIILDQVAGDATLSTTSGDVFLPKLTGDLRVSTTSGDASLGEVAGDMTLSTTSGELHLEEGQGGLDAGSVSGDIRVDALTGSFHMNTTSGTLSIAKGCGYGRASSVSGDIRIFLEELQGDLDLSTTSGTVDISLPKETSLGLCFDSTSGECKTFFDEALSFNRRGNKAEGQYGGGDNTIDVSTTSGDLLITEYRIP